MSLHHTHPDCTGRWNAEWISDELYWRCGGCSAALYHCDETARLALKENKLGTMLRQLADAGGKMLDAQGSEW